MATNPPRPGAPACQALVGGLAAPAPLPHQPPVFEPVWRLAPVLTSDDLSDRVAGVAVPLAQRPGPPALLRLRRRHAAARFCLTADLGPPWPSCPPTPLDVASAASSPRPPPRSVGAGRALSVRVPLCRCGSAARQGPGLASALCCPLPPSVAVPASDQRWPSCPGRPCPILRTLRPPSPPRASAIEASCALPLSGHTTPMVPAAHPRQGKPVTAASCGRSRLQPRPPATRATPSVSRLQAVPTKDNASLWQPAPG